MSDEKRVGLIRWVCHVGARHLTCWPATHQTRGAATKYSTCEHGLLYERPA
jgi:hypothetical protein